MKLILAIMSDDDAGTVSKNLTKNKFQVTKLASTGGFLKMGNTTLLIGVDDSKVEAAIEIIKEFSSRRKEIVASNIPFEGAECISVPIEVEIGGATIFVVDVEQFLKV